MYLLAVRMETCTGLQGGGGGKAYSDTILEVHTHTHDEACGTFGATPDPVAKSVGEGVAPRLQDASSSKKVWAPDLNKVSKTATLS